MEASVRKIPKADKEVRRSQSVLQSLLADMGPRYFDVRFWDGTIWAGDPETVAFTLVLRHPGAVRRMFWPPKPLSFSMAYVYDDFEVEGDMLAFQRLCCYLNGLAASRSLRQKIKLAWSIWKLPKLDRPRSGRGMAQLSGQLHSRKRDLEAISYHYDVSNAFFETILDPYMQYTTAIFANETNDLKTAQEYKLDLICRKLRLRPGEKLLDIGCGWGGLAMFAAKHYGVQAVGVTLSRSQASWAEAAIRAAGLNDRCRIELTDYRDFPQSELFDKISTIEVAEHFGAEQFPVYMNKCEQLLRPGGVLLMQQITLTGKEIMPPPAREFSQHFVFPDGELVPVSFTLAQAEKAGFEVRDVECFREHYPLTLKHWLARLEANREQCIAQTDEANYRIFRLYLSGAIDGFELNIYNVHQMLFVKPKQNNSELPLSRLDWYT